MKKIIAIILISVLCLTVFSSCQFSGVYDEVCSRGMEAYAMAMLFTTAIAENNYEKAMDNVHPDSDISVIMLENIIDSISKEHDITFPQKVKVDALSFKFIVDTENIEFDQNNATLEIFTIKLKFAIDGAKLKMEAVFLQNENGFGIYTYSLT